MTPLTSKEAGFGLVEIAVTLVIIGLMIGGVLKGLDLIESARLKTVLSQVNDYRLAVSSFIDRYDALPGDYHEAKDYIDSDLKNGNNSGTIDGDGLDVASEALSFWSHLSRSNLISRPGTPPNSGNAGFGKGAPPAKIGGGFTIQYRPAEDMPGHWFVLGEENGSKNDKSSLTPLQAMNLDKKADNGDPNSGRIRVKEGSDTLKGKCITGGKYNTQTTEKACIVSFQL